MSYHVVTWSSSAVELKPH